MPINTSLNNKVIQLCEDLIHERKVKNQTEFCELIKLKKTSFSHILSNRRSFPKQKIEQVIKIFGLPNNYFEFSTYNGNNDICEKIKHIRKLRKETQFEFAKVLNVSQGAISAIENKTNCEPSFSIISGLINNMQVNPYFLFSNDETIFDSQTKTSNKSKIDNILIQLKNAITELSTVKF